MPKYSFLPHDYRSLLEQKNILERRLKEAAQELQATKMRIDGSINSGDGDVPDTTTEHAYTIIAKQLENLCTLLRSAQVINPPRFPERVCLGSKVTIRESTAETASFIIGSYQICRPRINEISYASPLAKILIGAKEGELRKGTINGHVRMFEILDIVSSA